MITSEKVTQKSITRPFRSVHHTSYLSRDNRASISILHIDVPPREPLTTPQVRRIGYGYGRFGTIAANASANLEATTRILPEKLGVEIVEE